jgi:hypothetical protein
MLYVAQFFICVWLICLTVLSNAADYVFLALRFFVMKLVICDFPEADKKK